MKKIIIRIILAILFLAGLVAGLSIYQNLKNRKEEVYETLKQASLPVVKLSYAQDCSSELFGYTTQMQLNTMRNIITPVSEDHIVDIEIDYADGISSVSYEVRSLDGKRLVEDGEISGWQQQDNTMKASLHLSGLVDDANEYMLLIKAEQAGRSVYYYSRIIYLEDGHTQQMIDFAHNFTQASLDSDSQFIENYIQPDGSMGIDDYGYVNQHSRSRMITWKDASVQLEGAIETRLTELSASQATMELRYRIQLSDGNTVKECSVTENYVVRYRSDVLYLLDFERYTNEAFLSSNMTFDSHIVWLGISSEEPKWMSSPDGNITAYVYNRQLFAGNSSESEISQIFSFNEGTDVRGNYDHHVIQIASVENDGSIYFMVYGYQNRGAHEGTVGLSFYHYTAEESRIDEVFFIPADFSEQIFMSNMGTLAYVSENADLLYLLYANTVYSIDLSSGEKASLAAASAAADFYRSSDGSLLAWQEGDAAYPEVIKAVNLNNGRMYRIAAAEGDYLQIQGFVDNDLLYGTGHKSDVRENAGQIMYKPMYLLSAAEFDEEAVNAGEYEPKGCFVTGTEITGDKIEIYLAAEDSGTLRAIDNDQMFLNNSQTTDNSSIIRTRSTDILKKESGMAIAAVKDEIKLIAGQCIIKTADDMHILELKDMSLDEKYFAYAHNSLAGIYDKISDAVNASFSAMGSVTDSNGAYVWNRDSRALTKQLVTEQPSAVLGNSLEACIEAVVQYEGAEAASEISDQDADTPAGLFAAALGKPVLNLQGCSVVEILYYINKNHPVIAVTGDSSAEIITGYDSKTVTVYDPASGEQKTMAINDAQEYYEKSGCMFLSAAY